MLSGRRLTDTLTNSGLSVRRNSLLNIDLGLEARVGIEQKLVLSVATPRSITTLEITGPSHDRQRNRP